MSWDRTFLLKTTDFFLSKYPPSCQSRRALKQCEIQTTTTTLKITGFQKRAHVASRDTFNMASTGYSDQLASLRSSGCCEDFLACNLTHFLPAMRMFLDNAGRKTNRPLREIEESEDSVLILKKRMCVCLCVCVSHLLSM